jgi:hypothetical protein
MATKRRPPLPPFAERILWNVGPLVLIRLGLVLPLIDFRAPALGIGIAGRELNQLCESTSWQKSLRFGDCRQRQ